MCHNVLLAFVAEIASWCNLRRYDFVKIITIDDGSN